MQQAARIRRPYMMQVCGEARIESVALQNGDVAAAANGHRVARPQHVEGVLVHTYHHYRQANSVTKQNT